MKTVIESELFIKQAKTIWSDTEREEFVEWISKNWTAGDTVKGSIGAKKVRWGRQGSGKSGGARVVYYFLSEDDSVLLMAAYAKSVKSTMKGHE